MHVLQLGPYPPPEGGITRNLLAIREELRQRGHKCSVVATARSTSIQPEADVYHPPGPLALIRLLFKMEYDILHLHIGGDISHRVLSLIAICGTLVKGKKVLTLHSGGYAIQQAERAKHFSLSGGIFRRYDKIICVNSLMKEMFGRFGVPAERLSVVPPFAAQLPDAGVSVPELMRNFAKAHKPFLLTVGLLEDTYDLFSQIDAMEELLQTFPTAGLMIVGSGSLDERLKRAIADKPYAESILLTGDVEHKITLHLIHDCDILLRTTKFDGDAISIREALHLGTPVIATDNGMRPDGITLIPSPLNIGILTRKIIEVFKAGGARPESGGSEGGNNINTVVEIYQDLIEGECAKGSKS